MGEHEDLAKALEKRYKRIDAERRKSGKGPKPLGYGRKTRIDGTVMTKSPLSKRVAKRRKNK